MEVGFGQSPRFWPESPVLAKVGLAKVGLAKVGLAKVGRRTVAHSQTRLNRRRTLGLATLAKSNIVLAVSSKPNSFDNVISQTLAVHPTHGPLQTVEYLRDQHQPA